MHHLINTATPWFDPLSRAIIPITNGLLRRRMLRRGATEHTVWINGVSINYYHQGTPGLKPPILLIHGLGDNALTWALIIRRLSLTNEVYALDLPGYGFSGLLPGHYWMSLDNMRDLLANFVRQVVGRPALIAGNSMGGWLGIKLAWSDTPLVRALVLIDPAGAPLQGQASWAPFAKTVAVRDLQTARVVVRQMFGLIPPPLLYLGQRSFQEMFQRRVVREFIAAMSDSMQENVFLCPEDLHRLPVPAALIWGRNDHFLPAGSLEFFSQNLADAPTMLLRYCGHLPQRERPLAVVRFIQDYAAQNQ